MNDIENIDSKRKRDAKRDGKMEQDERIGEIRQKMRKKEIGGI